MSTIGAFLVDKMRNMTRWIGDEGGPQTDRAPTQIEATTFAEILAAQCAEAIRERNFEKLIAAEKENLPSEVLQTVTFVKARQPLHDKFWRYLTLFSDTVSNDGTGPTPARGARPGGDSGGGASEPREEG